MGNENYLKYNISFGSWPYQEENYEGKLIFQSSYSFNYVKLIRR